MAKSPRTNPETAFMLRWLADRGLEISPAQFKRVEGKFGRTDLPEQDQQTVNAIFAVCQRNYGEFLAAKRTAFKIRQQRKGK